MSTRTLYSNELVGQAFVRLVNTTLDDMRAVNDPEVETVKDAAHTLLESWFGSLDAGHLSEDEWDEFQATIQDQIRWAS